VGQQVLLPGTLIIELQLKKSKTTMTAAILKNQDKMTIKTMMMIPRRKMLIVKKMQILMMTMKKIGIRVSR
jgi:hypothetical protein